MADFGAREERERPYSYGRISEEATVVRNLLTLGAVPLGPRPDERRHATGFSAHHANQEDPPCPN